MYSFCTDGGPHLSSERLHERSSFPVSLMHTPKDGVNSMGQERQPSFLMIALLALLFFLGGCKLEETLLPTDATGNDAISGDGSVVATGSGSGITAPIISDPLSGSTISDRQPTLTVLNSAQSESESRTYLFQVSADTAFAALEAQSTQVPEGPNGSTSWELERTLAKGDISGECEAARARTTVNSRRRQSSASLQAGVQALPRTTLRPGPIRHPRLPLEPSSPILSLAEASARLPADSSPPVDGR